MKLNMRAMLVFLMSAMAFTAAWAEQQTVASEQAEVDKDYQDTVTIFEGAGESGNFFANSYGYALFPTIGKAGLIIGGAHGKGRVYEHGEHVGNTSVTQGSIGLQAGAQAFSQIIFFENKAAFDTFTSGNYEFDAKTSAVVITAAASAGASTGVGSTAGASGGKHDATTKGSYSNGMAIFAVAKGGLMLEAAIGGQKFSYIPLK
jgi:lipid-binding SYLF domain-containing protein